MKRTLAKQALVVLGFLVAALAPFFFSTFSMTIAITAIVFAIFAVSLNLILGHGGLPSLGHAAFFGTGAYAVALLVQQGITHFAVTVFAAIVVSALFGLAIGPVLLRTRGTYFLMATLAVGEVMRNIAISWRSVTNGDDGLYGIKLHAIAGIDLVNTNVFYYFLLIALAVTVAFMAMLMKAPFGHTLRGLRDNRVRMSVLGVRPLSVEMTAFIFSAGLAGFAGAMFAYAKGFVSPGVLSVENSANALLMVVLGGTGTLTGPIIGAAVIEAIRGIGSTYTDRWLTILGILAVIVSLDPPRLFKAAMARRSRRSSAQSQRSAAQPIAVKTAPASAGPRPAAKSHGASRQDIVLRADGIVKRFGGLSVLNGISLEVAKGERRGFIGPNGAGKTTFLNILSGLEQPNAGRLAFKGSDMTSSPAFDRAKLGIGRTFQIGNLFDDCTVLENVRLALLAREGWSLRFVRPLSGYDLIQREAIEILEKWSLRQYADVPVKFLSYGQRRILEIVLAMAGRPQLLLLDEPAAGLSGDETKLIIQTISALDPDLTILVVEHDMDLVFSVCDRVTVLANGQVLAEGRGEEIRKDKAVVEAYLGLPL